MWYTFDQAEGSTVIDQSGNRNDGALEGGASWQAGYIGNAVDLNGKDSFVNLLKGLLKNVDNVTISTWVKVDIVTSLLIFNILFVFGIGSSIVKAEDDGEILTIAASRLVILNTMPPG